MQIQFDVLEVGMFAACFRFVLLSAAAVHLLGPDPIKTASKAIALTVPAWV